MSALRTPPGTFAGTMVKDFSMMDDSLEMEPPEQVAGSVPKFTLRGKYSV